MAPHSSLHGYLEWTKQRLDEMDATIASFEAMSGKASAAVISDLKKKRAEFEAKTKQGAQSGEAAVRSAQTQLETQWTAFEGQVRAYFDTASKQLEQQQATFREAAMAQTRAWRGVAERLQGEAAKAATVRRAEVDAAIDRIKAQGAEAEAQLLKLRQAGNESWSELSAALAKSRQAFGRATSEAWDALSRAAAPKP